MRRRVGGDVGCCCGCHGPLNAFERCRGCCAAQGVTAAVTSRRVGELSRGCEGLRRDLHHCCLLSQLSGLWGLSATRYVVCCVFGCVFRCDCRSFWEHLLYPGVVRLAPRSDKPRDEFAVLPFSISWIQKNHKLKKGGRRGRRTEGSPG